MERTLAIIKPRAIQNAGNILQMILDEDCENKDIKINDIKMLKLSQNQARCLYEEHKERSNFEELISFMTSEPIIAIILSGPNIIKRHRNNMKSIRNFYADRGCYSPPISPNIMANAIHGSDSTESAEREISLIFN